MNEQLTPNQQKRLTDADEALQKADCAALHRLFIEAEKDVRTMIEGLNVIMKHDKNLALNGKQDSSSGIQEAILAVKEIALSAIDLAKTVSEK